MKEICALLLLAAFAFPSVAEAARCKVCLNPAPIGATVCSKCSAARKAEANGVVKDTVQRGQTQGIVIPDKQGRIETFCGYSFGSPLRKGVRNAKPVSDMGFKAIEVEEKVKKPFRFCTKATLRYAEANSALYSITLTSEPQRMSADKAQAEFDGILAVLRQKYEQQQTFQTLNHLHAIGRAKLSLGGQMFTIVARKVEVAPKATLKGSASPKDEAYVFTVCLSDPDVRSAPLASAGSGKIDSSTGADVL